MKNISSKIGLLIGMFVLLVSIPVGVYLATQQNQPTTLKSRASLTSSGDNGVLVYLWPAASSIQACDNTNSNCAKTKVEVIVNSGGGEVGGADLVLKYDPTQLEIINNRIYPGSVDENLNELYRIFNYYRDGNVDNNNGTITLKSRGTFKGERGVIATFYVNGKGKGVSKIEVQEATKVFDSREANNIIQGSSGMQVNIQ